MDQQHGGVPLGPVPGTMTPSDSHADLHALASIWMYPADRA